MLLANIHGALAMLLCITRACASFPNAQYISQYQPDVTNYTDLIANQQYTVATSELRANIQSLKLKPPAGQLSYSEQIELSNLLYGHEIGIALHRTIHFAVSAVTSANNAQRYVNQGRLSPGNVLKAKCYCAEFSKTVLYPLDPDVEGSIQLAHNQSSSFQQAASSVQELSSFATSLNSELAILDRFLGLEARMIGKAFLSKALSGRVTELKALDKKMQRSVNAGLFRRLELTNGIVVERYDNLTALSQAEPSFERARASIHLACSMARQGKESSFRRTFAYGRAKMGFCG